MSNKLGRGGILDLTGVKINSFEVTQRVDDKLTLAGNNYIQWLCKCECGKEFIVTTKQITRGRKSCGCKSFNSRFRRSLSEEQAQIRKIISHYICGAQKRDIEWNLSEEICTSLLLNKCYYCGALPGRVCSYLKGYRSVTVNGIDRIDNDLGYINDNVVSCCKTCNRAKYNLTLQEFESWIKGLIEHNRSKHG